MPLFMELHSFSFALRFWSLVVYSYEIKDETSVDNILSEIHNLKTRQSNCDFKVSELETVVTSLQRRNDILEAEVSALRRRQDSMRENTAVQSHDHEANETYYDSSLRNRRLATVQAAFTVGVSAFDVTQLSAHQTVIFDRAITNIGNTYNTNSGIFQAPIKGAYVFTLTMMVVSRHSEYLEIVVDGHALNDIFTDATSIDNNLSTTKQWILDLNRGSQVWIWAKSFENHGEIHGNMHTLFSGFLLFETA